MSSIPDKSFLATTYIQYVQDESKIDYIAKIPSLLSTPPLVIRGAQAQMNIYNTNPMNLPGYTERPTGLPDSEYPLATSGFRSLVAPRGMIVSAFTQADKLSIDYHEAIGATLANHHTAIQFHIDRQTIHDVCGINQVKMTGAGTTPYDPLTNVTFEEESSFVLDIGDALTTDHLNEIFSYLAATGYQKIILPLPHLIWANYIASLAAGTIQHRSTESLLSKTLMFNFLSSFQVVALDLPVRGRFIRADNDGVSNQAEEMFPTDPGDSTKYVSFAALNNAIKTGYQKAPTTSFANADVDDQNYGGNFGFMPPEGNIGLSMSRTVFSPYIETKDGGASLRTNINYGATRYDPGSVVKITFNKTAVDSARYYNQKKNKVAFSKPTEEISKKLGATKSFKKAEA